jgi:hypothetical protein
LTRHLLSRMPTACDTDRIVSGLAIGGRECVHLPCRVEQALAECTARSPIDECGGHDSLRRMPNRNSDISLTGYVQFVDQSLSSARAWRSWFRAEIPSLR